MNRKLFEVLGTLSGGVIAVTGLLAVLGFFMMISSNPQISGSGFSLFFICSLITGSILFINKYIENSANDEFIKYVEEHGGADHIVKGYFSGLAINIRHRIIFLNEDNKSSSFSLDDIRGWTNKNAGGGQIVLALGSGVNMADRVTVGAQVAGAQLANNHRKLHNTGIMIEVRNLSQPMWMIKLRKDIERNQCAELLQQVINES
jgi:hypothetical protein